MSTDPFAHLLDYEGVPSAFAAARDGIDALLRDRGLRKTTVDDTAESLARGAWASATLEGSSSTWEETESGQGDALARNVLAMSAHIIALVPVFKRAPLQALARLHSLAAIDTESPGTPVNEAGVQRLVALAGNLSQPTSVPGLIQAAYVHAEVLSARAFASHNGVVARAAERIVLIATGVDPVSLTVPELAHAAESAHYASAIGAYDEGMVSRWLLYAADAYTKGAEASPLAR